jgi:hypothetical protein
VASAADLCYLLQLDRALGARAFAVVLWDGKEVPSGSSIPDRLNPGIDPEFPGFTVTIPMESDDSDALFNRAEIFDRYNHYYCYDRATSVCHTHEVLSSLAASACLLAYVFIMIMVFYFNF